MNKKLLSILVLLSLFFSILLTGCGKKDKNNQGSNNGGNSQNNSTGGNDGNGENDGNGDSGGSGSESNSGANKTSFKTYDFSYFDTVTTIIGYEEVGDEFGAVSKEALELLAVYHKLFDIYNEYEGIVNLCSLNKVVNGQHQKLTVDRKIIDMLLMAKDMYTKTGGKMNIAMGSVLSIWHDYRTAGLEQPKYAELPPMDRLTEATKHTNINDIIIDEVNNTVWLADPEMKLDVGAFAKGYAVEMVAQMLEAKGKYNYVVSVGGNIRTTGPKANGDLWKTVIENPTGDTSVPYVAYIGLYNDAVVTSGSYQRFYIVNGKEYHHIIDQDTLMPADKGFLSVSVICKHSGMGDALSTALFCMTLEEGMALINSLDGVEAMWVMEDETRHYSNNFSDYFYE